MGDRNLVMILGRLGRDPEMRSMPDGTQVANISIATTEKWRDKQRGEMMESTEWHRVVFFGKRAEVVGKYLKKGYQVDITGKLRTHKWTDKAGADRYTTEIIGDELNLLNNDGGNRQRVPADDSAPAAPKEDFDDDIPF